MKRWTQEEDTYLKNNYPQNGPGSCSTILDRSTQAIKLRAMRLGIKQIKKSNWLKEEDQIIKELYGSFGPQGCVAKLPNRSYEAIKARAQHLKVKMINPYGKWNHSDYENALIEKEIDYFPKENYVDHQTKIEHECLKGHTWHTRPVNILNGLGCPYCNWGSYDHNKPGTLYYVKLEKNDVIGYKIGITNNSIKRRFDSEPSDLKITILYENLFEDGREAKDLEYLIIKEFDSYKRQNNLLIRGGNTEVFESDILNFDKQ